MSAARAGARPFACVIGDMDLVRPIGLAGIRCAVVAAPGDPPRFSRFTQRPLPWADPWTQPEQLIRTLNAFGSEQAEAPVLFYQDDAELLLISRQRDALSRYFRFVVPDAELVEALVDKSRFQVLARQRDLPVPPARVLDPAQQPEWRAEDLGLQYPIVLKPLTRRTELWAPLGGRAKAVVVESADALRRLWPALVAARQVVLAQEEVPGDENRIESYHVYVDESGAVAAEFTGRKIRTWPPHLGHSTALELTDAPDVRELGRSIMRQLGLRGVAKCDFKRGPAPDGRLHLLEINPRFTLWHHLGAVGGVNIPAIVYADLTGAPRPSVQPARAGVRWCKLWSDAPAARANRVPAARWLAWALGAEAKRLLAWDDPMPLIGAAMWRLLRRPTPRRGTGAPSLPPPKLASEASS